MKEGMYTVSYADGAGTDSGWAVLVFDSGIIWGIDVVGATYDGTYAYDKRTDKIRAKFKGVFPEGSKLVTGIEAPPEIDFDVELPRELDQPTQITLRIPGGHLYGILRKMRNAPNP